MPHPRWNRRSPLLHPRGLRALSLAGLLLLSASLIACGDPAEPGIVAPDPQAVARAAEQQQHLQDLTLQMESLERESEAVRREMLSRLDQIDVARAALANQIAGLKVEIGATAPAPAAMSEARPAPPAVAQQAQPAADAAASGADSAAPPAAESSAASSDDGHPFLRFLLLIFILGAVFFLGRIFFERWGDGEDGDRPPPVETTTDLGKIRFPAGTEVRPGDEDRGADDDEENGGRPGD